ncbi:Lysine methyltransferase/GDP dissociation inhibitor [Lotmaria passim]
MSDDEGLGDLFGGVEAGPEYPLQTLSIDRLALAAEGFTYDYFEPLLDRFDHVSSAAAAAVEVAQLRERLVALAPPPLEVKYRDKRHSLWGHKLWNAAKYIVKRMDERLIDVRGKTVIELGAGLGVPTLAAFKNGAQLSVVTDYPDDDLLDIIKLNVEANCVAGDVDADVKAEKEEEVKARFARDGRVPTAEELRAATLTRCVVEPLLWGKKEHIEKVMEYTTGGTGYDIVILSDILFNHVCNDDLADTLATLLAKSPQAAGYCVFSHHRAYKQLHDLEFFDKCTRRGLKYEQIDEQNYPLMFPDDRGPEEVRQPVKCYKIVRRYDAAGHGLDVGLRFDVVLQGTGMVQSILSAALARSGLKVLHCDGEDHYAAAMATFEAAAFLQYLDAHTAAAGSAGAAVPAPVISIDRMSELPAARRRRYLFDVLPMSYLARGPLLRKLAAAGMTTSLECQHVSRLLFLQHGIAVDATTTAMEVPLTRATVFGSTAVNVFDKRRMMRFVKDVEATVAEQLHAKTANPADDPTFANTSAAAEAAAAEAAALFVKEAATAPHLTLRELLKQKYDLAGPALDVVSLMGMMDVLPTPSTTMDGYQQQQQQSQPHLVQSVDMVRDLLLSTGAFNGKSPYLTTSYGAAEVAQSLCRVSAVWGGVYVLRRSLRGVAINEERETQLAILSNGQWVPAKVIVAPVELTTSYLTYRVQDWFYDVLREHELGRTPLIPLEAAGACAASSLSVDPQSSSSACVPPTPAAVRFSRVVLATKSTPLFSWASLTAAQVVEIDESRDYTAAAPVLNALVREPETQAVVWVMQQSFACDQAPSREEAEGGDACIIHFTADAHQLPQEQLYAYVKRFFIAPASASSVAATTADGGKEKAAYRIVEGDLLFAAAFTIDSGAVAQRGLVMDTVELPSETRWTHLFGWMESTKLRHANEHDRQHLLRTRASLASAAADSAARKEGEREEEGEAAAEATCPASPVTCAGRAEELCRNSEHFHVVPVPTLLPNFVYDGHYMQCAETAYETVLRALGIDRAAAKNDADNPYEFLKALPVH